MFEHKYDLIIIPLVCSNKYPFLVLCSFRRGTDASSGLLQFKMCGAESGIQNPITTAPATTVMAPATTVMASATSVTTAMPPATTGVNNISGTEAGSTPPPVVTTSGGSSSKSWPMYLVVFSLLAALAWSVLLIFGSGSKFTSFVKV